MTPEERARRAMEMTPQELTEATRELYANAGWPPEWADPPTRPAYVVALSPDSYSMLSGPGPAPRRSRPMALVLGLAALAALAAFGALLARRRSTARSRPSPRR